MDLLKLYQQMIRIRVVEEGIAKLYPEQEMRCPVHLSTGQEATAVGVCAHLKQEDWVFSTHRCHAHYLAKGGDLGKMIAELYGKETGCCQGRGGSMHLNAPEVNFYAVPIVASAIPIAVGVAKAIKARKSDQVVVCFFGDAAVESGQFYEAVQLASLWSLPILFVCENNGYSVSSPIRERQIRSPVGLAAGLGLKAFATDGMNIDLVHRTAGQALQYVRSCCMPCLVEFGVIRMREHCGPDLSPDLLSITSVDWELGLSFRSDCLWRDAITDVQKEFAEAVKFAKSSPFPSSDSLLKGVLA